MVVLILLATHVLAQTSSKNRGPRALAGGGKGAAIGAGVGAGAGTGVAAYTGKQQAVIPSEALVAFTITNGSASSASLRKRSR